MTKKYLQLIGNTPLVQLDIPSFESIDLFAKLEFYNPTGSVKDRAASYVLQRLLEEKKITKATKVIESSSGNYGIALSAVCNNLGLNFYCVIDPNITKINEAILNSMGINTIKVNKADANGGYLLTRLEEVQRFLQDNDNSYWVNQYNNPYVCEAYETLGNEIISELQDVDYVFVAVSSAGTITGVSRVIKEHNPKVKVIAVDTEGSVIFGCQPKKRTIPGIGSSIVPANLKMAQIDDVVFVDEKSAISMCKKVLKYEGMLVGGSSGTVLSAVQQYFSQQCLDNRPKVAVIFPDRGDRYIDIIY